MVKIFTILGTLDVIPECNYFIGGDNDMTKESFEDKFCKQSEITLNYYKEHFITLPCEGCGYEDCNGWAAVSNNELSIKAHQELFGGKG